MKILLSLATFLICVNLCLKLKLLLRRVKIELCGGECKCKICCKFKLSSKVGGRKMFSEYKSVGGRKIVSVFAPIFNLSLIGGRKISFKFLSEIKSLRKILFFGVLKARHISRNLTFS